MDKGFIHMIYRMIYECLLNNLLNIEGNLCSNLLIPNKLRYIKP